jgi:hypothetical protein
LNVRSVNLCNVLLQKYFILLWYSKTSILDYFVQEWITVINILVFNQWIYQISNCFDSTWNRLIRC